MAKYKVGQIVTCVDDTKFTRNFKEKVPVLGGFYTVRSVIKVKPTDIDPCIRLLSIVNSRQKYPSGTTECSFRANRFLLGKQTMPFFTVQGPRLLTGGGGGGASPISVPVAFWWDATSGATVDGSNNITTWNDLSGNTRHLTPAGGTALNAVKVASVLNGLPGVRFDISGDHNSALTTTSPFTLPQPFTLHVVWVAYSGASQSFAVICGTLTTLQLYQAHDSFGGAAVYAGVGFGMSGGLSSSTPAVFSVKFNGSSSDGYLTTKTPVLGANAGTGYINADNFQLGYDAAQVGFGGYICEVFGYAGVDSTNFTDSRTYILAKWGVL